MIELKLHGCASQPLASYLKGLGIFRLVSAQADAAATGRWGATCFELRSSLDRRALIEFFLTSYQPSPVVAPWNAGSGFYAKDRKVGIEAIRGAGYPRFKQYAQTIAQARGIVERAGLEKGASKTDEDDRRLKILRLCRNELADACVDWLDAAIAISADGLRRAFAPILGTGGNEGRLDYTNNFMENLANLLIAPKGKTPVRDLLENAIFDSPSVGFQDISVGQYDPGRTGGFNQGQGIESSCLANPWTAILTIEGAIAWAGGIYRKQGVSYRSFLCSPFTVRPSAAGYGSASEKDNSTARAEIWTPLWDRFARYDEIRGLFREGRASLDGRPATNGIEFAEAVASLSVDRGIGSFVRYSLLKRRGDSYIAPPLGRLDVSYRRGADLVRQLSPILDTAERMAKNGQKDVPNSWPPLRRGIEEAMLAALMNDAAHRLRDCAVSFGRAVRWFFERRMEPPFKWLDSVWVARCREASPEAVIAASLASLPKLNLNLLAGNDAFSWSGRDLTDRMLNTLQRRTLQPPKLEGQNVNASIPQVPLHVVQSFLNGNYDDRLIEDLLFAFLYARREETSATRCDGTEVWPVFCLLKLLFLPGPIEVEGQGDASLKPDSIPSLLAAGRLPEASAIAVRRLRVAGLNPLDVEYGELSSPRRLGAALLIPFSASDAKSLLGPVCAWPERKQ